MGGGLASDGGFRATSRTETGGGYPARRTSDNPRSVKRHRFARRVRPRGAVSDDVGHSSLANGVRLRIIVLVIRPREDRFALTSALAPA